MQHLPRNMEHVDRRELFTSLPAKIAYLHAFLEFGPEDIAALVDGQKYIKMVVPAVVNMVYKKLLQHDSTARVFSTRDSRSEVDPEVWVTEEGPQIRNRKMFLRWYLTKLNTDPTSMEYWEYLDKGDARLQRSSTPVICRLHVPRRMLGLHPGRIFEAILSHPRLELTRKIAITKAIAKVIWIQNDLIARWHMKDGEEYQDADTGSENLQPTQLDPRAAAVNEDKASLHSSVHSSDSGRTSLGRTKEEAEMSNEPSVYPFSGTSSNQEYDMAKQRTPKARSERDSNSNYFTSNSGVPRLQIFQGKVVGKEKLDLSLLSPSSDS
ncbi:hypothetical protein LTR70_009068 [Exophiala xenobiotica]|uniref:Globin-sensor domain-containing protein n=1 Tax=Lithohypha guttulata TaxID=1690604 RepID=A0ABR0KA82_9EURO|nr:hypothetical protein LTR24_005606 [Lithohypha guttulata]KAK5311020.1 hypothetical protein LTR70_009068 [Exophiala xenobiotica]